MRKQIRENWRARQVREAITQIWGSHTCRIQLYKANLLSQQPLSGFCNNSRICSNRQLLTPPPRPQEQCPGWVPKFCRIASLIIANIHEILLRNMQSFHHLSLTTNLWNRCLWHGLSTHKKRGWSPCSRPWARAEPGFEPWQSRSRVWILDHYFILSAAEQMYL